MQSVMYHSFSCPHPSVFTNELNPILNGVWADPIAAGGGGGGAKSPSSKTVQFGICQQRNLIGIDYRPRTFQNTEKNW